jgi:hypothetical protein
MSDADGGKSHFEGREIAFQIKGNLSFIPFLFRPTRRTDRKAALAKFKIHSRALRSIHLRCP